MKRPDNKENHANTAMTQAAPKGNSTTERLLFPIAIHDEIIHHTRDCLPNEACGLVAFDGDRAVKVFRGTNILDSPTRYRMADEEVIRAVDEIERRGWRLGAIYHSHPSSPAVPSDTDLDEANWPKSAMMIVSFAGEEVDMRAYRIDSSRGSSAELDVEIVEPSPEANTDESFFSVVRRYVAGLVPRTDDLAGNPITSGAEAIDSSEPRERTVVGILGGMGPAATGDLYLKIVAETPADSDQDHIPVVIYSDPRVPDRTDALLYGGEDPVPWLVRGASKLESMGADFIVIPCNTAHAFLDEVEPLIGVPVLSMLETAADAIAAGYPGVRRIGLLATTGTIRAGIYQDALSRRGLEVIVPTEELLEHCVMPAIRAVKANNRHTSVRSRLVEAADYLERRGAHAILAACTEIPVILTADDISLPLIDATEELAKASVREALERDARRASTPLAVAGGWFHVQS